VRVDRHRLGLFLLALELAQLALEVVLQAAAVLTLEVLENVDLVFQLLTLLDEAAHDLAVALLGVAVEVLGPGTCLTDALVGLMTGLAQDVLRLLSGPAQGLVGL